MKDSVIQKFNRLKLREKCRLVSTYGKWIWYTDYQAFRISCFELEGAFVEVWYHLSRNRVEKVQIPTYKQLDVHLDAIKLPLIRTK